MDTSELPIAFMYAIFISVYVYIIRSFKDKSFINRFVFPIAAIAGSLYIVFAAVQKDLFIVFIVIMAAIAILGFLFDRSSRVVKA